MTKNRTYPAPETLDLAIQQPAGSSLAALRSLVVDSVSAPNSKRAYGRAVDSFLAWHQRENRGPFSKALLQAYCAGLEQRGLAPATINVDLSAPAPPCRRGRRQRPARSRHRRRHRQSQRRPGPGCPYRELAHQETG